MRVCQARSYVLLRLDCLGKLLSRWMVLGEHPKVRKTHAMTGIGYGERSK